MTHAYNISDSEDGGRWSKVRETVSQIQIKQTNWGHTSRGREFAGVPVFNTIFCGGTFNMCTAIFKLTLDSTKFIIKLNIIIFI